MEMDELITAFEAGTIGNAGFPHERHIRVAWGLAQRYERTEALRRLNAGIRRIAADAGRPGAYHETITRAWFELVADIDEPRNHPELFDKTLLNRYYSTARLAAGRAQWLEPDLHPLRLPPPEPAAIELPDVLRRIPTGVAVLAVRTPDTVHATTVSSITSVSRTPALISVCLANRSRTLDLVAQSHTFALSLLAAEQDQLAALFARTDRPAGAGQFDNVPHHTTEFGPAIEAAAAWIGCTLHAAHPCGDHHIIVGEVGSAEATLHRRPLVRHDGAYH